MKRLLPICLILFYQAVHSQNIIKIIPDYVLIDTDKNIGSVGDTLITYRSLTHKDVVTGYLKIVRFHNGKTAAKIIEESYIYKISQRDFVKKADVASNDILKTSDNPRGSRFGIGLIYTTNLPLQKFGLGFCTLSKSFGFYFDFRVHGTGMTIETDDDFYTNISVNEAENIFEDEFIDEKDHIVSYNFGITLRTIKGIYLFGGIGRAAYDTYRQYYDQYGILGAGGRYWITGPSSEPSGYSAFGGILINIEKVFIQAGYCSKPKGYIAGIGIGRGP